MTKNIGPASLPARSTKFLPATERKPVVLTLQLEDHASQLGLASTPLMMRLYGRTTVVYSERLHEVE